MSVIEICVILIAAVVVGPFIVAGIGGIFLYGTALLGCIASGGHLEGDK